jgi:hypothetical protein
VLEDFDVGHVAFDEADGALEELLIGAGGFDELCVVFWRFFDLFADRQVTELVDASEVEGFMAIGAVEVGGEDLFGHLHAPIGFVDAVNEN